MYVVQVDIEPVVITERYDDHHGEGIVEENSTVVCDAIDGFGPPDSAAAIKIKHPVDTGPCEHRQHRDLHLREHRQIQAGPPHASAESTEDD